MSTINLEYKVLCIKEKSGCKIGKFYDVFEKDGLLFLYEQDTNIELLCWVIYNQVFKNSFNKYFVKITIQERRRKIIEELLKL